VGREDCFTGPEAQRFEAADQRASSSSHQVALSLIGKKLLRSFVAVPWFSRRFNGAAMAETVACTQSAALCAPYCPGANRRRLPLPQRLAQSQIFTCTRLKRLFEFQSIV
jgi:hypothetical protein